MKITIERDSLLNALTGLNRIIEARSQIPILTHARFQIFESKIILTGTDLDIEARISCPAQSDALGSFALRAHVLLDILRKLDQKSQLIMVYDSQNNKLGLSTKKSRFHLATLSASDFPDLPAENLTHDFLLKTKDLITALSSCQFAICAAEARYYLNGIFMHIDNSDGLARLHLVATNGHSLARFSLDLDGSAELKGVIIPRKTILSLLPLLEKQEPDSEIAIYCNDQKIRFDLGETQTTLTSKLIDGTYPDYQRVIPRDNLKLFKTPRDQMIEAVERVLVVNNSKGNLVSFAFQKVRLAIAMSDPLIGEAQDEIDIDGDEDVTIGFNGRYILDILNTFTQKEIHMNLKSAGDQALFSTPDDARFIVVLMPMRL